MNTDRDKFLTEAMGGKAFVNWRDECQCGCHSHFTGTVLHVGACCQSPYRFSTPEGFFKLWDWVTEQEWYWKFIKWIHKGRKVRSAFDGTHGTPKVTEVDYMHYVFLKVVINPDRFADAVCEFLKEEKR